MPALARSMALCAAFITGVASLASAQPATKFPERPVRFVLPYGPGGVADVTTRLIAQKLSESMGQNFVIENKPGAGGILAAKSVLSSPADGYTYFLTGNASAINQSLFKTKPHNVLVDFTPVATLAEFEMLLVTKANSPLDTIDKLVAQANAHPGKLNFGTINLGSTQHLSAEMFRSMAGVDATVVPFKGSPAVITALRANDVQVAFEMLAPVIPQAKSGAVRILAVTSEKRHPSLPDVPTVAESGVPGYAASSWNAIAAPAKTPPAIVERLQQETARVLAMPEVRDKLAAAGVAARASTPDELKRLLASDVAKWRRVIEQAKIERQ